MRRQFTADVYKDTDFMTLKHFYKALQRDTGVDDKFFMFDYPVPKNEGDYQEAVKLVKHLLEKMKNKPRKSLNELRTIQKIVKQNRLNSSDSPE